MIHLIKPNKRGIGFLAPVAAVGRLSNHCYLTGKIKKAWPAASTPAPAPYCSAVYTLQRCPGQTASPFLLISPNESDSDVRPVRRTLTLLVGEKLSHQRTVRNFNCPYTLILIINNLLLLQHLPAPQTRRNTRPQ